MYVHQRGIGGAARLVASVISSLGIAGCGAYLTPNAARDPSSTLGLSTSDSSNVPSYVENGSNDLLPLAEPVDLSDGAKLIEGRISSSDDVDVYDLGPVEPGDHITVSVEADAAFDGAIALFDDTGAALLVNDHRNVYLGRNGPFVDVVVRRSSTSCRAALTSTPGFPSQADYVMTAANEPSSPIPEPRADVILLVFNAERNIRIGSRPAIDVPAFDAADISSQFDGRTEALRAQIVTQVREDFEPYDVTILSTSEGASWDSSMSRVFFGTYDDALLGVAEGVDEYNAYDDQVAIVFTDTFSAFMPLSPSLSQIGEALANVASHEIGHLLGLVHTSNPDDLMDVTASLSELMMEQEFVKSPLYSAVFPVGEQDSAQSLLDTVGGDEGLARARADNRGRPSESGKPKTPGAPARQACQLSRCGIGGHQ